MSGPFNNKHQEENAKAEQIGAAIAIVWFLTLFVLLPLAILFPPVLILVGAGIIWAINRMVQNRKK